MNVLAWILLLVLGALPVAAQEIYKWEDEKGVIHYGDRPQPGAKPLAKEKIPYSNLKEGQGESSPELEVEAVDGTSSAQAARRPRKPSPRPSPTMKGAKAWIDRRGDLWLSGIIRNGGKGTCETPGVEITVIDELGSIDGQFELTAKPGDLARGEEGKFSGKYFTPIGDKLSWEATPRCGGTTGVFRGARKRGMLKIPHSRTVQTKRTRRK